MIQLIKRNKMIWLFVLAISFLGCEDDDEAKMAQAVAGFVHTIDETTGEVAFLNLSENANSYSWSFGDGTSSTLVNPEKIYATGTYTVVLTATNAVGSATFEDEIVINIPLPINFPVNFDDPNVDYAVSTFGGTSFGIVDNPDVSGSNDTNSKVGAITNGGSAWEGIVFELGEAIDLTTEKTVKMDFWSNQPVSILLKLEVTESEFTEVTVNHGGSGWEELSFNFSDSGTYPKMVIFVDGPGTTSGAFYFDNIVQAETDLSGGACTTAPVAATTFPVDFEACESFVDTFANDGSITTELFANPDNTGLNTSANVLKVVKASGTNKWAGFQNAFPNNLDATKTLKLKVYSTKANVVMKFEVNSNPQPGGSGNPGPQYATVVNANTWTEVEVLFTGIPGNNTGLNQLVIKPDNPDGTDGELTDSEETYYFDDIEFVDGGGSSEPATAAPTPMHDASNVKSVFSDTYTDIAGSNLDTNWQGDLVSETVSIQGNDAIKYSNVKFIGMQLAGDTDFSDMEFVHIDIWTPDATDLQFTPISPPDETLVALPNLQQGQWQSFDIALGDFTGVDFTKILQFKIDAQGGFNPAVVYMDNLYFYKSGAAPTEPTMAAPTPTRNAADVKSIFSDAYTDIAGTNLDTNWQGDLVSETVSIQGNDAIKYSNVKFIGMQLAGDTDFSDMEFVHIDIWTPDATDLQFTPISPPDETLVALPNLQQGQWQSFDIALSDFTGVDFTKILQFKIDAQGGFNPAVVFMDNLYFYKGSTGGTGGCSGAPVPATMLPLDFEGCESFTSSFSSAGEAGVVPSLDINPSKSGINTSDNVLKVVKTSGINRWGGVQNSFPSGTIDITTKVFKIKVYSSVPDVTYRFELALDPQTVPVTGNPAPVFRQVSGGANTWTEIEFTFINLPAAPTTYNQLVIKPDNPDGSDGEVTTEERTFYFDDLKLE